ncbi:MAG: MobA/MobL family protein [Acidobacteriota bacterium]|nr:MobA/MobL family protein [Acidobacteriota bacterium]
MPPSPPPLFHLAMSVVRRSAGRSSVAASAYRSASRMTDQRTGLVTDYRPKTHVTPLPLILPAGTPAQERESFWNAVEAHHRRRDAVVAREIDAALPHGLSRNQESSLAERFGKWLADTFRIAVDIGLHRKPNNHHLDILLSSNAVLADGSIGKKVCELDAVARQRVKGAPNPVEIIRAKWAELSNEALVEAGRTEHQVDHRSYQRQGVALKPGFHLGRAAHAMETKEPGSTDIGARLAKVKQENQKTHSKPRRNDEQPTRPPRPGRKPRAERKPRADRRALRLEPPVAGSGVPGSPAAAVLPGGSVGLGREDRRPVRRRR